MKHVILLLALLATLFVATPTYADNARNLPVVEEAYDEIVVITFIGRDSPHIFFIRNGRVIATRVLQEEMLFFAQDGKFFLEWDDYWSCHRIIEFKTFISFVTEGEPHSENGPWWAMGRKMVDLKQPPPPPPE